MIEARSALSMSKASGCGEALSIRWGAIGDWFVSRIQVGQEPFGSLQVRRFEAFGEHRVDRAEKIQPPSALSQTQPQRCHVNDGSQFPGLGILLAGDPKGSLEMRFGFWHVRIRRRKSELPPMEDGRVLSRREGGRNDLPLYRAAGRVFLTSWALRYRLHRTRDRQRRYRSMAARRRLQNHDPGAAGAAEGTTRRHSHQSGTTAIVLFSAR